MEYARLETATLKDVTDAYYYGCHCTSCLHSSPSAGLFVLSLHSPGSGGPEARLRSVFRNLGRCALDFVVTSV